MENPKGRLFRQRNYLVGSIDACPESGAPWRDYLTPKLEEMGIYVYNPLKKPTDIGLEADDNRKSRAILKQNGKFDEFASIMRRIRHVDLRMVDLSDFIIAYLNLDIKSFGTIEEIVVANKQKKPVLVVCKQGKNMAPDWLFGMIPHYHIFNSFEELISYLEQVNYSETPEASSRWIFFNYE